MIVVIVHHRYFRGVGGGGSAICCAPSFAWGCVVIAKYKTSLSFEAKNGEAVMQYS